MTIEVKFVRMTYEQRVKMMKDAFNGIVGSGIGTILAVFFGGYMLKGYEWERLTAIGSFVGYGLIAYAIGVITLCFVCTEIVPDSEPAPAPF